MSKNSYRRDPAYTAFAAYMSESFSELPQHDAGRNDPRRMCFDDMGLPEELLFFLWKAASRPAADESAKPVKTCRHCDMPLDAPGFCVCNGARYEREQRAAPVASKEAVTLKDEEIAELRSALDASYKITTLLTHKIITCGVAARHPDANLSRTGSYGGKWNSPQAEEVRKLRDERDALLAQRDASKAEGQSS